MDNLARTHDPRILTRVFGWRVLALAGALVVLALGGDWFGSGLGPGPGATGNGPGTWAIVVLLMFYVAAMATPFVPGFELGLAVMMVLGTDGIVLVYLATQLALAGAFVAGRRVPVRTLADLFGWLGLERARQLVDEVGRVPPAARMELLAARTPDGTVRVVLRHPLLAIALALNLPGNGLVGGAGGIAMIAGLTGACGLRCYVPVVAIATTPLPLLLLWGHLV